jgi:O-antigen ligase
MEFFYNYFSRFLIVLFPFSFITGLFLPNLIVFTLILITIFIKFEELKNTFTEFKKFVICFFLFYFLSLLSSIFSESIYHSLETSLFYFAYALYVFVLIIFFRSDEKNLFIFFYALLFCFFIICIDAVYELIQGQNILGFSSIEGRIAGLFNDRWVIGSYLVRFLPILVGIFFINFNQFSIYTKFSTYFVILLSSFIVIFSGERVAYLLLLLFFFIIFLYFLIKKRSLKFSFLTILIVTSFFALPFLTSEKNSNRLKSNIYDYLTNYSLETNQYYALYYTSLNMFMNSPIIGVGPNNFRKECNNPDVKISKYSCSTHPHNTYFQLLAEVGILGFLSIFSVFIFFCHKLYNLLIDKSYNGIIFGKVAITSAFILNLWPFIPSGNFFSSWMGFIYFLPLSLYLIYKKY